MGGVSRQVRDVGLDWAALSWTAGELNDCNFALWQINVSRTGPSAAGNLFFFLNSSVPPLKWMLAPSEIPANTEYCLKVSESVPPQETEILDFWRVSTGVNIRLEMCITRFSLPDSGGLSAMGAL